MNSSDMTPEELNAEDRDRRSPLDCRGKGRVLSDPGKEFKELVADRGDSAGALRAKIEGFSLLVSPGWDGYDADPINKETIAFALEILESGVILEDAQVWPAPNGAITFEGSDVDGEEWGLEVLVG